MQYLVFGANGYVGSYIYERMKEDKRNVIGTGRAIESDSELLHFDILNDDLSKITPAISKKEKTAIVCIAVPNIDKCLVSYSDAYQINVVKTKQLIHELAGAGFHVIFFSSDNVFDGRLGGYTEESMTNAINKYGGMKAEMEKYLLSHEPDVCIFRIPKVVGQRKVRQNVFNEWERQVKTGYISCIRGNRISFIAEEDIYQACVIASQGKLSGLFNIAGDKSYSRKELAKKFFCALNVGTVRIEEDPPENFGFKDNRPLDVSLVNSKFKSMTGYEFTSMDRTIEGYIDN